MDASLQTDLIRRMHAAPHRAVVAVTGGGARAIAELLAVPGASRTVLEAVVPYSSAALVEWLRCRPDQFCSSHAARLMAMVALDRAARLRAADATDDYPLIGLGCTASLVSDRPKRGPHRVHVAAQAEATTWSWSLDLTKEQRSREQEEAVAAALLLDLAAEAMGLANRPAIPLLDGETIERRRIDALPEWIALRNQTTNRTDRRRGFTPPSESPRAVFPGSFHPLHEGHRQMAAIAAARLGTPVDFELSIENVDKPPLDYAEMEDRAAQFSHDARVWFTRAPRMKQKAALFPGATIVCGIDTLLRVADAKYAEESETERDRDIAEIAGHGCRFLVFGRTTTQGFETADDVPLPAALRRICDAVPESEFRADVSSTELRQKD